jgi:hypothetical protein
MIHRFGSPDTPRYLNRKKRVNGGLASAAFIMGEAHTKRKLSGASGQLGSLLAE